jgi:hypothetical protein
MDLLVRFSVEHGAFLLCARIMLPARGLPRQNCRGHAPPFCTKQRGLELERAYTGLKKDSKAVEVAMELNRLYPGDPEILYQTGKVYGNFAFLTMEKLAQVAPTSAWRHSAAAEAH